MSCEYASRVSNKSLQVDFFLILKLSISVNLVVFNVPNTTKQMGRHFLFVQSSTMNSVVPKSANTYKHRANFSSPVVVALITNNSVFLGYV